MLGIMFLREWYVKRKIKKIYSIHKPGNILDAGSGFGQYSYFLSTEYPFSKIVSVDVKQDQINDCKYFFDKIGRNNIRFQTADLTELKDKVQYDFILSVDVMEHIEDDISVLKRFNSALRNNGRLMINTPSDKGGSDADHEHDESFIEEHVRNGYSKEEITSKLTKAGFKVESFEYTYGKWGNRYWRLAIKFPMQLLNISKIFFLILPLYYIFALPPALLFMYLDINEKNKTTGTGILVVGVKT
jgi:2-polyprenyl-3-methyl-5-hydroxy-6-metoxy-1,4-benzoquinol methylase